MGSEWCSRTAWKIVLNDLWDLWDNQSFSRLYSSQHIPQELFIRTFGHYFESEWIVLSAVNFETIVFLEGRKCDKCDMLTDTHHNSMLMFATLLD